MKRKQKSRNTPAFLCYYVYEMYLRVYNFLLYE